VGHRHLRQPDQDQQAEANCGSRWFEEVRAWETTERGFELEFHLVAKIAGLLQKSLFGRS
jgi:hypothetical protein